MRQIRHWTQNDLLQTVTGKNTGKGIPRFYLEEPTLEIAGILMELSKCIASLDVLKPVARALYEGWDGGDPYLLSSLTHVDVFLQVSWETDPDTMDITVAKVEFWDDMDEEDDKKPDPEPTCSILINMSQVMSRVFANKYADEDAESDE